MAIVSTVPSMTPAMSASASAAVRGAQRRVHLEAGVVGAVDGVLGEEHVMRGGLAGHGQALGLGGADHLQALGGGDVLDVQLGTGEHGDHDVAHDLELLALRRPAEQAEAGGNGALGDAPAVAARAEQVAREATVTLGHALRALADDRVPDLDGAALRIGGDVALRHAQQLTRVARNADVHELTGLERGGETRGRHDERADAVGDLLVRNDLEVMHARRRRIRHICSPPHARNG